MLLKFKTNRIVPRYVILFSILLISSWVFFNKLGTQPSNLNPDEADTLQTYLIAKHQGEPDINSFNWNGAPAINMYLIGWTWELFGRSVAGLRTVSAVMGILIIGMTFLLITTITRRAFLAAAMSLALATNPWFLNFTRSGWENSWNGLPVLLIVRELYLLREKHNTIRSYWLLITGIVLGFYFYHPGKLFAPVVFAILLIHRLWKKYPSYWHIFMMSAIVFALVSPQLYSMVYSAFRPGGYDSWDRIKAISVYNSTDNTYGIAQSSIRNTRAFLFFEQKLFQESPNGRYIHLSDRPVLLPLVVVFIIGLIYCILRFPLIALFYFLIALPVQIFSKETPNAARAVHIVPLLFIIASWGIHFVIQRIHAWIQVGFVLGLIVISVYQYRSYVSWIQDPRTLSARNPAVDIGVYDQWLEDIEKNAREGKRHLPVHMWLSK